MYVVPVAFAVFERTLVTNQLWKQVLQSQKHFEKKTSQHQCKVKKNFIFFYKMN